MPDTQDSVYLVKHIRWKRGSMITDTVPILLQDINGPCPILAIFNILLLRGSVDLPHNGVGEVLQSKVVQLLAEYLLDTNFAKSEAEGEDVYRANLQFNLADAISMLPQLTTGIDVNVKFNNIRGLEFTAEVAVFDLLGIDLVHGWVVDPQDVATRNALQDKTYNEVVCDIIACAQDSGTLSRTLSNQNDSNITPIPEHVPHHTPGISQAELASALELSALKIQQHDAETPMDSAKKLRKSASATSQDSVTKAISCMMNDTVKDAFKTPKASYEGSVASRDSMDTPGRKLSSSIESISMATKRDEDVKAALLAKDFLEGNPSQLTVYGLACLVDGLREGQFAVFFRNNHFNVMLKHENCLYLLVTDQGYQNESDIVWEKLTTVDGDTEFVGWNFESFKPHVDGARETSNLEALEFASSAVDHVDQENADYSIALQMQQEEDMRAAAAAERRRDMTRVPTKEKKKKSICTIM
uniref:MINDY deubiquitinase domain-containing protein n=1 Tax=Picochlorum oklahomense TaxID=249345 RepID=A0A7S1CUI2_9CHLO|mmetsp:Transcript_87/g.185  ORF Transcript_87/g.185 Transcript_87/m.185 type:complete len:471 (+) Transcript_87:38-1450(+)